MATTTDVVQHHTQNSSPWSSYRRHGYFFREAAMLTILLGGILHLDRVLLGDVLALHHLVTVTSDRLLLVPMTYAAITGSMVWHRVRFANTRHRAFFTGSLIYIAVSVPLHIYISYVSMNVAILMWFPVWFSYFLLIAVYPALLTMFFRLRYQD